VWRCRGGASSMRRVSKITTRIPIASFTNHDEKMTEATETLLVTGGAGFIGSALVRLLIAERAYRVVNLDLLTYAGHLESLGGAQHDARHVHVQADIADAAAVRDVLDRYAPSGVLHLAAESHVDRSIDGPGAFVHTNIMGTFTLLQEARRRHEQCVREGRPFRFLHVSTDEVFGSLHEGDARFTAETPYDPRSPYSASKASSDHLVRAWGHTYGLPVVITNCSNNYGPYQYPEKLIPLMIANAIARKPLPMYGTGANIRDWLYVDDHARAILSAFERGEPGGTYLVGGDAERTNLEVVRQLCDVLDARLGRAGAESTHHLVTFVNDRPGHDFRYAIDASATREQLGWTPRENFTSGLEKTVDWYLTNQAWCDRVTAGAYTMERLGLGGPA
jgi:dTDP-glucose 4,6-dehydratase